MIIKFHTFINENYINLDINKYYLVTDKKDVTLKKVKDSFDVIPFFGNEYFEDESWVFFITSEKKAFSAHNNLDYLYEIVLNDYNIKSLDNEDYISLVPTKLSDEYKKMKSWDRGDIFEKILKIVTLKYPLILCDHEFNSGHIKKKYLNVNNIKKINFLTSKNDFSDEPEYENSNEKLIFGAFDILKNYMSKTSENIQKKDYHLFSNLQPNKPLKIYRGMNWGVENLYQLKNFEKYPFYLNDNLNIKFNRCTSWSTNKLIAEEFASSDELWIVIESTIQPEDILVDTRLLDKSILNKLYQSYQREIIVKPNTYNCKIYKIGLGGNDKLKVGFDGYDYKVWEKIHDTFEIFCDKFIEKNKIRYKKVKFLEKNQRIFGDYVVEVPLLMLETYYNQSVIEIRYDDKYIIQFNKWGRRTDFKSIIFESYDELLNHIRNYSELESDINKWM